MKLIEWSSDLSVNIEKIDQQHLVLVEMINDLNDAMLAKAGQATAEEIVEGLIHYTETHFKTEEDIFDQYSYPETEEHKAEHRNFVKKVSDFNNDLKSGKIGLSVFILDFLSSWLKNHIKITDKKYTEYLNSRGVI